jgi:hypothetical protein
LIAVDDRCCTDQLELLELEEPEEEESLPSLFEEDDLLRLACLGLCLPFSFFFSFPRFSFNLRSFSFSLCFYFSFFSFEAPFLTSLTTTFSSFCIGLLFFSSV